MSPDMGMALDMRMNMTLKVGDKVRKFRFYSGSATAITLGFSTIVSVGVRKIVLADGSAWSARTLIMWGAVPTRGCGYSLAPHIEKVKD